MAASQEAQGRKPHVNSRDLDSGLQMQDMNIPRGHLPASPSANPINVGRRGADSLGEQRKRGEEAMRRQCERSIVVATGDQS